MDEIVRKLAGVGLPAVILLITMATTGLTGAAAITAALAMLGPGGMIGGIVFLGIIGLASDALAKYGLESVLVEIYKTRLQDGESSSNLYKEIAWLPISDEPIVRTFFWASAETLVFSLARSLWKRAETCILPLAFKNCPEC